VKDPPRAWSRLGLVGSLLALSVFLVHVPAALWAGNARELHVSIDTVLGLGLAIVAVGAAIFAAILWRLPPGAQAMAASLAAALGIVVWTYGLVLVGGMQALDGNAPLDFGRGPGTWELLLVVIIGLALAATARRWAGATTSFLAFLNIGLVAVSLPAIATAQRANWKSTADDTATLFGFSPRTNVLVVLLDGLQSDIAADLLEQLPALRAAFDGFSFYPDTLGAAPTTFLGLPAIHSGEVYTGSTTPAEYFTRAIATQSFVTRFANAGYTAALVNPLEGICPAGTTACTSAAEILGTASQERWHELLRLYDLSLFRIVPFRAKSWVWNRGRWRLSRHRGLSEEEERVLDVNVIHRIAEHLYLDPTSKPSLKIIHSLATHTPYVMNEDCETVGASTFAKAATQARCGLVATAHLLNALRRISVYDRTAILILADHGLNAGVYSAKPASRADAWRRWTGSANPLFLFKPLGRRGPLRTDTAAVSVADAGATLCAATSACATPAGIPAGQSSNDRLRFFDDYVWRHEFWGTKTLPGITYYQVRGPLSERESWQHVP
jgi:hypothetical protein